MKSLVRVAVSLLISVVLFAGFAFIAFSGLFDYIESRFYDERIENLEREYVKRAADVIDIFHQDNIDRFQGILGNNVLLSAFSPNQSREEIAEISNLFDLLTIDLSGFTGVRFLDTQGFIHFSTFDIDYQATTGLVRQYRRFFGEADDTERNRSLVSGENRAKVLTNGIDGNFIYRLPVRDISGPDEGIALFYVAAQSLSVALVQNGVLDVGAKYSLIDGEGILLKYQSGILSAFETQIGEMWVLGEGIGEFRRIAQIDSSIQLLVYAERSSLGGTIGSVINEEQLALGTGLKILLLASFFLTTFLIVFLLFSIRQDKVLVLSDRIKRFQITFLKEYVGKRDEINWDVWKRDLGSRREEVRKNIKKGLGRIKDHTSVDTLIEKSWEEILNVIGTRVESSQAPQLDAKNLEDVIRRVVGDKSLMRAVGTEAARSAVLPASPIRTQVHAEVQNRSVVGAAEDVEELEEVGAAEDVEELEEGGAAEDVEELEEVGAAEDVEELEEVGAAEDVEELEEVGAAEDVEELEEVGAAEDVEELEELGVRQFENTFEVGPDDSLDSLPEIKRPQEKWELITEDEYQRHHNGGEDLILPEVEELINSVDEEDDRVADLEELG